MTTAYQRIRVPLGPRAYDIQIGAGVVAKVPAWLKRHPAVLEKRAFIISDERLTEARAALCGSLGAAGWEVHEFPVHAGERLKQFEAVFPLYGALLKAKATRNSVVFALGGGSIGDTAGFVAATYLRGISWVGIPTTLLAQVDSSVGGKTGINHPAGKNLIGAFHQPSLVVCDTDFLRTLNPREVISGLGEIVKYGIIYDPKFFFELENNIDLLLRLDPGVLTRAVRRSLHWKCKAVAHDEFDRTGLREILNFGHTFGHALESVTRYKVFQHGEAILWGMRFALALSQVRKKLSEKSRLAIDHFLSRLTVPPIPDGFGPAEFFEHMKQDKKVRAGKLHFVLLNRLGRTVSDSGVQEQDLQTAYDLLQLKGGACL